MVLLRYVLISLLAAACQSAEQPPSRHGDETALASPEYLVLAQKALTYQADFRLDDWAGLLSEDVEYHLLAGGNLQKLRGKAAVLAHWQAWKGAEQVQEVRLSGFTIFPFYSARALPLANLPGVYVPVVCRQRVTYISGQVRERPLCLWIHFNGQKLIDRLYGFDA